MNKKQVKSHKECIKWWLDNPDTGVYTRRHDLLNWSISHEPDWLLNYKYVPNDEYSDLRMAQIDGKVIQFTTLDGKWLDVPECPFAHPLHHYRIKPEEPKFEKDEWVMVGCDGNKPSILKQFREYSLTEWPYIFIMSDDTKWDTCKLWQPQKGEWCVFYDNSNDYLVAKFDRSIESRWFYNIAPLEFAQTLKDK